MTSIAITPTLALEIYQLAMLIKDDFTKRNPQASATDADVIAGLQADVARVVGKVDDWDAAHPSVPPAL